MRVDLNREAPIGLGGRIMLNPGINEVKAEDWAAVRHRTTTKSYVAKGIVVPHEEPAPKLVPALPTSSKRGFGEILVAPRDSVSTPTVQELREVQSLINESVDPVVAELTDAAKALDPTPTPVPPKPKRSRRKK